VTGHSSFPRLSHNPPMCIKPCLLCLCFLGTFAFTRAADALYSVTVTSNPAFEVVGNARLSFFPFSEQMGAMIRRSKVRAIVAADATTITLRTDHPEKVLTQVLRQIGEQTGLKLSSTTNSQTPRTDPVFIRQVFSDTAVLTLVLAPAGNGLHHLACHYVIDERPEGSNDGTPAAIAEMAKMMQEIQGTLRRDNSEPATAK
jgi:hypothetical protein